MKRPGKSDPSRRSAPGISLNADRGDSPPARYERNRRGQQPEKSATIAAESREDDAEAAKIPRTARPLGVTTLSPRRFRPTLRTVLRDRNPENRHGTTSQLSEAELEDLVSYLLSLDGRSD
jgi:hypothetical protein